MEDDGSKVGTNQHEKLPKNKGEEGGRALAWSVHAKKSWPVLFLLPSQSFGLISYFNDVLPLA